MAVATEVFANETEIKQAMEVLGLDNWADNEIEIVGIWHTSRGADFVEPQ